MYIFSGVFIFKNYQPPSGNNFWFLEDAEFDGTRQVFLIDSFYAKFFVIPWFRESFQKYFVPHKHTYYLTSGEKRTWFFGINKKLFIPWLHKTVNGLKIETHNLKMCCMFII